MQPDVCALRVTIFIDAAYSRSSYACHWITQYDTAQTHNQLPEQSTKTRTHRKWGHRQVQLVHLSTVTSDAVPTPLTRCSQPPSAPTHGGIEKVCGGIVYTREQAVKPKALRRPARQESARSSTRGDLG